MIPPILNSPRSSATFEAILHKDERLRRLVLLSGAGLLVGGATLILLLPFTTPARLLLLLLWLGDTLRELRQQQRGFGRVRQLNVTADGEIRANGPGAEQAVVTLCSGSLVLRRVAWLRIRFADGLCYGEPLADCAGRQPGWAHFRLVWQQNRQRFWRR